MSELIQQSDNRATIRWKLFASVSAAALIASAYGAGQALAEDDTGKARVWIELGAQLEHANGGDSAFVPPFFSHLTVPLSSPASTENQLPWSLGPEGKIFFQPEGSDWVFSAGIRYGRAKSHRATDERGEPVPFHNVSKASHKHYYTSRGYTYYYFTSTCCHTHIVTPTRVEFSDVQSTHQERHLVLDFQAGKDVGLGLFGRQSASVVSAGVRFAQFQTKMDVSVKARADLHHSNFFSSHYTQYPQKYFVHSKFHNFSLDAGSARDFRGIGPSISWDASATIAGNPESSELTFDWGVNAALLFGKQKAHTHHQSSGVYKKKYGGSYYHLTYNHPRTDHIRSRSVVVPNIGGMAGFSIKFPNAKVSIGYRADIFFNAMDGGWDTAKKENRAFYGPFASISIGLGD